MKKLIYVFLFIGLLSCDRIEVNNNNSVRLDKELINELFSKSVDTLAIESMKLVLDAYLWRDFMPVSPPNGKSLLAVNWLISVDSTDILGRIDLIEQYVIYGDSIWISEYENEIHGTPAYKIEKISRNGPKWGPNLYVDIISKIHDSNSNKDFFLKLEDVYISRTD